METRNNSEKQMVIAVDFDGTCAPFVDDPDLATVEVGLLRSLNRLSSTDNVKVVVISGRGLDFLAKQFANEAIDILGSFGGEQRVAGVSNTSWVIEANQHYLKALEKTVRAIMAKEGLPVSETVDGAKEHGLPFIQTSKSRFVVHCRAGSEANPSLKTRCKNILAEIYESDIWPTCLGIRDGAYHIELEILANNFGAFGKLDAFESYVNPSECFVYFACDDLNDIALAERINDCGGIVIVVGDDPPPELAELSSFRVASPEELGALLTQLTDTLS